MSELVRQISILTAEDDLTRFWAHSYGLVADTCSTLYANDLIDLHGHHYLVDKLEHDIVRDDATLLFIDISSIQFDPFLLFDLKIKYKLTIVLLAIDDEMKFSWISSTLSTIADLVITSDYTSVDRYRQSGINAHFLPLPVYIPDNLPVKKEELEHQLSFIGRIDKAKPLRVMYLDILEKETDISVFGNKGFNGGGFLLAEEMYSIFRNSTINLNFTGITVYGHTDNALFARIRGMKLRPFEIYAAGGMCLSEFSISLAQCFKDGEEIVFFNNPRDMLEKIKYFLSHKEEAKKIADAGRTKVVKNYSDQATAKSLKRLLQKTDDYKGVDLFGMPHELLVSRLYASTFIELIIGKSLTFLFKGKFKIVYRDTGYLIKFVKNLWRHLGLLSTVKVCNVVIYRSVKTQIAKIKRLSVKFVTR